MFVYTSDQCSFATRIKLIPKSVGGYMRKKKLPQWVVMMLSAIGIMVVEMIVEANLSTIFEDQSNSLQEKLLATVQYQNDILRQDVSALSNRVIDLNIKLDMLLYTENDIGFS